MSRQSWTLCFGYVIVALRATKLEIVQECCFINIFLFAPVLCLIKLVIWFGTSFSLNGGGGGMLPSASDSLDPCCISFLGSLPSVSAFTPLQLECESRAPRLTHSRKAVYSHWPWQASSLCRACYDIHTYTHKHTYMFLFRVLYNK